MRVYISGGITGVPDYKRRFARAERHLKKQGFSVINPAKMDDVLPEDCEYEDYMKIDLALLDLCDAIYLLRGWQKSCGANREYNYALNKGMSIMFQTEG